jgi:hypothetical protein
VCRRASWVHGGGDSTTGTLTDEGQEHLDKWNGALQQVDAIISVVKLLADESVEFTELLSAISHARSFDISFAPALLCKALIRQCKGFMLAKQFQCATLSLLTMPDEVALLRSLTSGSCITVCECAPSEDIQKSLQSSLIKCTLTAMFQGGVSGDDRSIAEGMLPLITEHDGKFIADGASQVFTLRRDLLKPITVESGNVEFWSGVRSALKSQHQFVKHLASLPIAKASGQAIDTLVLALRKDRMAVEKLTEIVREFTSKQAETVKTSCNVERILF